MLRDVVLDVATEIHNVTHKDQALNARSVYRSARTTTKLVRVVTLFPPNTVHAIDEWGLSQGAPTRTAALKLMIEAALKTKKASDRPGSNSDASTTTL